MIRATSRAISMAAAFIAAAFASSPAFSAPAHPFGIDDVSHIVALSSPQISPDGKSIVVVVTRINFKDDKYERDLDLIDMATHARRTLTYKRTGLSDPTFSPSGDRLAFIGDVGTGEDMKSQIFVMPLAGGDARPVTDAPEGVDQYAWRPDGEGFAYAAQDAKPKTKGAERFRDGFEVGNAGITARGAARPVHLWTIGATGGTAHRVTKGASSVATGEAQSSLSWSKDGKTLAFLLAPNAVLNDVVHARVTLVDLASGTLRTPTDNTGYEGDPQFSPDGSHVAFTHSTGDNQITLDEAYAVAAGGGTPLPISHAYDRAVQQTAWMPDSKALLFAVHDATSVALVRATLDGKTERMPMGDVELTSALTGAIAKDGGIAFVGTTSNHAPEVYYRTPSGVSAALSDYNTAVSALATATSESIEFPTSNGMHGDAVVLRPPGYTAGTKYPLVLLIHGGPTSASSESFDRQGQLMAARGWLVLKPNYRGSDNLGLAYQRAVQYDPEDGPGKDIMAAVNVLRARGSVDDRKIAVSGWSYGGIMTAWLITHYHIWKAAVSGASVDDWITDYSVADDLDSDKALFHGSPFVAGNRAEWERASAVNYAKDVTTPTLILSDNGDNRDPVATSYIFFRALRDNGKDVTFVAYPVSGHFPRDPVRTSDVYARWMNYIGDHFKK